MSERLEIFGNAKQRKTQNKLRCPNGGKILEGWRRDEENSNLWGKTQDTVMIWWGNGTFLQDNAKGDKEVLWGPQNYRRGLRELQPGL